MATHSNILAQRISWTGRSLVGYSPQGHKESDTTEAIQHAAQMSSSTFLCMGRRRVWVHGSHSFHGHLCSPGQNPACFHIPSSSVLTAGSDCSLMAVEWQVLFSFLSALRAQKCTFRGPESLMDCDSLVYRYGRSAPFLKVKSDPRPKRTTCGHEMLLGASLMLLGASGLQICGPQMGFTAL